MLSLEAAATLIRTHTLKQGTILTNSQSTITSVPHLVIHHLIIQHQAIYNPMTKLLTTLTNATNRIGPVS